MTLIDADIVNGSYVTHFVLSIPSILKENLYSLYKTQQVGLMQQNTCIFFDIPEFVYSKNNEFYQIDMTNCKNKGELNICLQDTVKAVDNKNSNTKAPCLRGEINHCSTYPVECISRMIYTKAGLFILSMQDIFILGKNATDKSTLKKYNSTFGPSFLSWNNFQLVLFDNKIITALNFANTEIYEHVLESPSWQTFLNSSIQSHIKQNWSTLYNLIEKQKQIQTTILDHTNSFLGHKTTPILATISIILWAITIGAWCLNYFWEKITHFCRIISLAIQLVAEDKKRKTSKRSYNYSKIENPKNSRKSKRAKIKHSRSLDNIENWKFNIDEINPNQNKIQEFIPLSNIENHDCAWSEDCKKCEKPLAITAPPLPNAPPLPENLSHAISPQKILPKRSYRQKPSHINKYLSPLHSSEDESYSS